MRMKITFVFSMLIAAFSSCGSMTAEVEPGQGGEPKCTDCFFDYGGRTKIKIHPLVVESAKNSSATVWVIRGHGPYRQEEVLVHFEPCLETQNHGLDCTLVDRSADTIAFIELIGLDEVRRVDLYRPWAGGE